MFRKQDQSLAGAISAACILLVVFSCEDDRSTNPSAVEDFDMVSVGETAGFPMGWVGVADDEKPVHTVSLDGFNIGKYEVTYKLWSSVRSWAERNGYAFENEGDCGLMGGTDLHPVTDINWRDCIAWCNAYSEMEHLTPVYYNAGMDHTRENIYRDALTGGDIGNDCVEWDADGFRLPTEAEWEFAARYSDDSAVTSGGSYSGCDLASDIDQCAWYLDNARYGTHPVARLRKNGAGAFDMSGNVWEWCWDWFDYYPDESLYNPRGPESGDQRLLRGGSFAFNALMSRSANRFRGYPYGEDQNIGFRVCRAAQDD